MKKILFALLLFIAFSAKLNAQTEKGTLLFGGGFALQASEGSTVVVFNPNLGIFILNNIAVGGQFILVSSDGGTAWALGPYIRGYFAGSDRGKFFVQGGLNIAGGSEDDTHLGFGIGAGYAVFLNRSIALEMGVSYNHSRDVGIFGVGVGFQIHYKR